MAGTALVLEGGGYRGIYTGGVLDVLMENGIRDFSSIWGTSAGALNGGNFKSGQKNRTLRVMLAFRDDPRMMSLRSFVTTGNITNTDFMYDEVQNRLDPFDSEAYNACPIPMYAVASDVVFGTPGYLKVESLPEDLDKIRASASIPGVSQMVEVDGHLYLDGGMVDSVAFEAALGLGEHPAPDGYEPADKALVVLTRDRGYIKPPGSQMFAVHSHRYDDYPYFLEVLKTRSERYNAQRDRLWELEREGRCLVIAPEDPVTVKVNETRGEPLLTSYLSGRAQAERRLEEIRAFIAS